MIMEALRTIHDALDHRADDARTRALRAKVENYVRVCDRWATIPPTAAQQAALYELVDTLRREVTGDDPPPESTVRPIVRRVWRKRAAG